MIFPGSHSCGIILLALSHAVSPEQSIELLGSRLQNPAAMINVGWSESFPQLSGCEAEMGGLNQKEKKQRGEIN